MSRIIFAGTPDFAAVHLQALLDAGIRPVAVYTQPDRPARRGHKLLPTEVKQLALENGLEVLTPDNFKDEADIEKFESFKADLCIVVAYGVILPQRIIDAPRLGCINVHGSILPRYRGAAPIQRSLIDGDAETGVSIMKLCLALDAGDVYTTATTKILDTDTAGSLFDKVAALGAKTLIESLPLILEQKLEAKAQDESLVTYAKKLSKEESQLDYAKDAVILDRLVRGLNPWPVATTSFNDIKYKIFEAKAIEYKGNAEPGTIINIDKLGIEIACINSALRLVKIQAPNKKPVLAADLARSQKEIFVVGKKFD